MIIAAFDVGENTGFCIVDTLFSNILEHSTLDYDSVYAKILEIEYVADTIILEEMPGLHFPNPMYDAYKRVYNAFYEGGLVLVKPGEWKPVFKKLDLQLDCRKSKHEIDAYGMIVHFMFKNKMHNYGELKCVTHLR